MQPQLAELTSMQPQLAELTSMQPQLTELTSMQPQLAELTSMQPQLAELTSLHRGVDMFERFTGKARTVVIGAQEQARTRHADAIRTEHLLAAVFAVPDSVALTVLTRFGITQADVESDIDRLRGAGPAPSDAEALATLGIDLDEVRRQVEEAFGPGALDRTRASIGRGAVASGHIAFDRAAKKTLELSLREAVRLKHSYIGTEHLLLGLLHTETGAAHHILAGRGLTLDQARVVVDELVRGREAS